MSLTEDQKRVLPGFVEDLYDDAASVPHYEVICNAADMQSVVIQLADALLENERLVDIVAQVLGLRERIEKLEGT